MGVFRADPGPARAPRYFFRTTGRLELASKPVCRWGNAGTWSGPVAFPASSEPWILTIFGSGKPVFLRAGRVFGAQTFFVCRLRVPFPLTTPRGGSTRPVRARAGGVAGSTDLAGRPRIEAPKPPPKHSEIAFPDRRLSVTCSTHSSPKLCQI